MLPPDAPDNIELRGPSRTEIVEACAALPTEVAGQFTHDELRRFLTARGPTGAPGEGIGLSDAAAQRLIDSIASGLESSLAADSSRGEAASPAAASPAAARPAGIEFRALARQLVPLSAVTRFDELADDEVAEVRRKFAQVDRHGVGTVTAAEVEVATDRLATRKLPASAAARRQRKQLAERLEAEGGGQVGVEQLFDLANAEGAPPPIASAAGLRAFFEAFDKKGRGSLERSEATEVLGLLLGDAAAGAVGKLAPQQRLSVPGGGIVSPRASAERASADAPVDYRRMAAKYGAFRPGTSERVRI